jgi:hypothetical protein
VLKGDAFTPGDTPAPSIPENAGNAGDQQAKAELPKASFAQALPGQHTAKARKLAPGTESSKGLSAQSKRRSARGKARVIRAENSKAESARAPELNRETSKEAPTPAEVAPKLTASTLAAPVDASPPEIPETPPEVPGAPPILPDQIAKPALQAYAAEASAGTLAAGQDAASASAPEAGPRAESEMARESPAADRAAPLAALPQPAFGSNPDAAPNGVKGASAEDVGEAALVAAPRPPMLAVVETTAEPAQASPAALELAVEAPPAEESHIQLALADASAPPPHVTNETPAELNGVLPKPAFGAAPGSQQQRSRRSRSLARRVQMKLPGATAKAPATRLTPGMPANAEATTGSRAGQSNGGQTASGLPEPVFGGSARPPLRLVAGDASVSASRENSLPGPSFRNAASAPTEANDLAVARISGAAPLSGNPHRTDLPMASSPTPPRASLANTSPRMPGDPAPIFSPEDELILQLQTPKGELSYTITAFGTRSAVYLPLAAIARFLDLAIPVSDGGHYASGWFLSEDQTLSINLRQGSLIVKGKELSLFKSDAAAFDGELYLRAERFAELFPLTLAVDLRAQTVTVKTTVPFPFEERIAREEDRARLANGSGRQAHRWPREQTPYQVLSFPMADAELRGVSDSTLGTRAEGEIRLAGDIAFMTARGFASATSRDGLTGARIELGRRDPDGRLLGPLRATEFQLGDVITSAMPLGLRGVSGRGAFISSAPVERASVFDAVDLRGELPDGYEVELYRNNILIGSTRTPVNGQYQFLKTSVDYGLNVFRLVFFGPQGQRHEEVRQISVGDGRLSKGQLVYSIGAAQKDVNVFNVRPPEFRPGDGYGTWRGSALLEYGVTGQVTASLGAAWYQSEIGNQWLATAGLRTGFGGTALKLDLGYQSAGGKAAQLGLGGQLFGLSYTVTHGEYSGGFTDEVRALNSNPLRRATELNVNSTIQLGSDDSPKLLQLNGQLRRIEFADGHKQTDATLRNSLPLAGLMLSNTLTYSKTSLAGGISPSQLAGTFDLATLRGSRLQLRASVDYAVLPKLHLRGALLDADYALDERTLVRASIGHTFTDSATQLGLSAVRRFRKFELAFDGNYAVPTGNYSAALRLGFSFGRNPLNGRLIVAQPGLATGGAVAARTFRDINGNNRFDDDEPVLPNVEFAVGSARGMTDKNGIVFIGGLGDGTRSNLVADRESLPDIDLAPVKEGVEVVPRAGRVHVTNYALQELSEIEGTAFFSEGEDIGQAVSGLRLELVGSDSKVLSRSRTEGDGSFFFEQVRPGTYSIQLDKNQVASLKIELAAAIPVTVGPKSSALKQVVRVSRKMQ